MAQFPSPSSLHNAQLIRFLSEKGLIGASATLSGSEIGQKLGDWLDFREAIALHGLLSQGSQAPASQRAALVNPQTLRKQLEKMRGALEQSILQTADASMGLARIEMPQDDLPGPIDPQTAYEPYRRFYVAHQRQMESAVRNLRAQIRKHLGQHAQALQALAALDAAFESVLGPRENALLAKLPSQFQRRFSQALKAQLKHQAQTLHGEDGSIAPQPWLLALREDMRSALLAELDLRMQPLMGLIEALAQHTPPSA